MGLALFLTPGTGQPSETGGGQFDFSHVQLALRYFEAPSEESLARLAATPAALHLKRHSDRTGYFPATATARDITEDLVAQTPPRETLEAVRNLVRYAEENPARQKDCRAEAAAYLPEDMQPDKPLYVTWGYDIGVAMDDTASLNFAHSHFLENPQEIWFYCIHELHHTGVMRRHRMPEIPAIDTVQELYDFTRYVTFLEGLAVHAARAARRSAGALGNDPDYVVLEDTQALEGVASTYWSKLAMLQADIGAPLNDAHWQVIEDMSSGDRLWYIVGAAMAAEIERTRSRSGLLQIIRQGAEAFFSACPQPCVAAFEHNDSALR